MSDDDLKLSDQEAAALRQAAQQFGDEGRVIMRPSRRLAALRAQAAAAPESANSTRSRAERISHWPAAAVALVAVSMLGLALLWGKAPLKRSPQKAELRTAAEDAEKPLDAAPEVSPTLVPGPKSATNVVEKNSDPAQFDSTETLAPGAAIHVENIAGNVKIAEADTDTVSINATKQVNSLHSSVKISILGQSIEVNGGTNSSNATEAELFKEIDISVLHRADGDLQITTVSHSTLNRVSVVYDIRVPRSARLGKINTSNGDIQITGASGKPMLQSISGNIRVSGTRGEVTAKTSNGDIEITNTTGAGRVQTISGNIQVKAVPTIASLESSNGDITVLDAKEIGKITAISGSIHVKHSGTLASAHTSNGDIEIDGASSAGPLSTISGSIGLRNCGGLIRAESSNGDIEIIGASGIERIKTVSGEIRADVNDLAGAAQIHSSNGSVQLRISEKLNASIKAKTSNGSVQSSVRGIKPVKKGDDAESDTLQGVLGDGTRTLMIDTISGDISIAPLR